ncbi:MAG: hypothetical protein K6F15_04105 [Treponema sp.]|nr:hypothetical protein [Treponema sp.]
MTDSEKLSLYDMHKENAEKYEAERLYQQHNFDTWLLKLCAGSFAVSFAFIEKLIDFSIATNKCFVILSWTLFAFCLLLEIYGYLNTEKLCSNAFYAEWEKYKNETENAQILIKTDFRSKISKYLNKISFFTFMTGIVCLIIFVSINL